MAELDVMIIGGGPAGLGAAMALKRQGIDRIAVIEREGEAGGVPRHCAHPPFGWREFRRFLNGPEYCRRLREQAEAAGIEIRTRSTVTRLASGAAVQVISPEGIETIRARRALVATGCRETPRSTRLVGGTRPLGVETTGALQAMIYLKNRVPFRRPVVIGTELVSFSALLTCARAGIDPVAMIEQEGRAIAEWPAEWYPRLRGIPVYYGSRIVAIEGTPRVEAIRLAGPEGEERRIACDGVLFTGRFVPESALIRESHLVLDAASGGPVIDQHGRCSDPAYFAAGNLLRPVETAGWSWAEGRTMADCIAADLDGRLGAGDGEAVYEPRSPVKLVVPQSVRLPKSAFGLENLQLRVERPVRGKLEVSSEGRVVWQASLRALPERRYLIPIAELSASPGKFTVAFREEQAAT